MAVFLKVEDVAARYDVSTTVIYSEIRKGHMKIVRVGRLIRVREEDLKAYEERQAQN